MKATLIFDIGKTNKKLFVFDRDLRQVHKEYIHFDEVPDEDGYPGDDLSGITEWIRERSEKLIRDKSLYIEAINFSTYGASLVHLDGNGKPLTPLYNYTKPYPEKILQPLYEHYGGKTALAAATGSPPSGMLNSGFQLYWLKHTRPEIFHQIRYSLHFPQYLSYLFSGLPVSDYTSTGCHTSLWDYQKADYHKWVFEEGIASKLPPIAPTFESRAVQFANKKIRIGSGIHDSSAALLPYLLTEERPFLLISTGTWCISLNPFSKELLTPEDMENDCLNYMRPDGKAIKASRLFLGNEYKLQVDKLCKHFGKSPEYCQSIPFNKNTWHHYKESLKPWFRFESILTTRLDDFPGIESAYHCLMKELVELQVASAKSAIGNSAIEKVYVDGGFASNAFFIHPISDYFSEYQLFTAEAAAGSAVGAALAMAGGKVKPEFLREHYGVREYAGQFGIN